MATCLESNITLYSACETFVKASTKNIPNATQQLRSGLP